MPGVTEPTVTRVGKYGHVKVEWPDPPRRTYEITHEALAMMIENVNEMADELQYERAY